MYMKYRSFGFSHYVATWGCGENHFQIGMHAYIHVPVWWYPGSRYGYTLHRLKDLSKVIRHHTWFSSTKGENATRANCAGAIWSMDAGLRIKMAGWPWVASWQRKSATGSLSARPRKTYILVKKPKPKRKVMFQPQCVTCHVSFPGVWLRLLTCCQIVHSSTSSCRPLFGEVAEIDWDTNPQAVWSSSAARRGGVLKRFHGGSVEPAGAAVCQMRVLSVGWTCDPAISVVTMGPKEFDAKTFTLETTRKR